MLGADFSWAPLNHIIFGRINFSVKLNKNFLSFHRLQTNVHKSNGDDDDFTQRPLSLTPFVQPEFKGLQPLKYITYCKILSFCNRIWKASLEIRSV